MIASASNSNLSTSQSKSQATLRSSFQNTTSAGFNVTACMRTEVSKLTPKQRKDSQTLYQAIAGCHNCVQCSATDVVCGPSLTNFTSDGVRSPLNDTDNATLDSQYLAACNHCGNGQMCVGNPLIQAGIRIAIRIGKDILIQSVEDVIMDLLKPSAAVNLTPNLAMTTILMIFSCGFGLKQVCLNKRKTVSVHY